MRLRRKVVLGFSALGVLLVTGLAWYTRTAAIRLITNPAATRKLPHLNPGAFLGAGFEEVVITNREGLRLVAWYIPSENRAAILAQHGYKMCRDEMLPAAAALHRHGYGVLLCSIRAHDRCAGEQITFGVHEAQDLKAWLQYLVSRPEVDPERIGALGNSLGGSLVIQLAAQDSRLKAVAADSPFSSLQDTLATSVAHFTGLPSFPCAPLIYLWAERETGCDLSTVSAKAWIRQISPRPVLLMQGGQDGTISQKSGQVLFQAAGEPKELWYDPNAGHACFATNMPAYENRVVTFFDQALRIPQRPITNQPRPGNNPARLTRVSIPFISQNNVATIVSMHTR